MLTSTRHGEGANRALYDPISWNYHRSWSKPTDIGVALRAVLTSRAQDPSSARGKLELWTRLAQAEAENYLAHLSRKHGLKVNDPHAVLDRIGEGWNKHCLARKRYLIWAATKSVAAGQFVGDNQELDIGEEIRLRAEWLTKWLALGRATKNEYCFVPNSPLRTPTLLQTMEELVLPLGQKYWMEIPRDHLEHQLAD